MNTPSLNDKQIALIEKWYDHECGLLETFKVRRLLSSNDQAQKYLQSLRQSKVVLEKVAKSRPVDLWGAVKTRIDVEERAAVLLGKRSLKQPVFSLERDFFIGRAPALVFAVAAFAVVMGLYFTRSGNAPVAIGNMAREESIGANKIDVALTSKTSDNFTRPEIIPDRFPPSVEVDWVRSRGRVHMLPDGDQGSTIIWIKKQPIRRYGPARSATNGR